jgi:hypothetical protein
MAGVYENIDDLIGAVSKETGVSAQDVRKVLGASFASTRAYVARELTQQLADTDLDKVAGGASIGGRLVDKLKPIFQIPTQDV